MGPVGAVVGLAVLIVLIAVSLRDPDDRPLRAVGSADTTTFPENHRAATEYVEEATAGEIAGRLRSMAMWRRPEAVEADYAGKWLREPGVVGTVRWEARESAGTWMLTVSEIGSGVHVIALGDSSLIAFPEGADVYVKGRILGADATTLTLSDAEVLPREK